MNSVKFLIRMSFLLNIFVSNGYAKLPIILNLVYKINSNNVIDNNIDLSKNIF